MQNPPSSKKALTFQKLSACVLKLEISKGHLLWKVTDLEAKSKLSRSIIYRYLGNTKENILRNSLQIFIFDFYGLSTDALVFPFEERVKRTREYLIQNPEITVFYLKWRATNSWIEKELIAVETKFQQKLKKLFPSLSEEKIWILHAQLHGIVTAPFLSPAQAGQAAREAVNGLIPNSRSTHR